jgi:Cu/Ag efflux protein CusF
VRVFATRPVVRQNISTRLAGALAVLLLLGALVACSHPMREFALKGEVISKSVAAGEVTITHEAIPDLMPAMTATFPVEDPSLLQQLQPGDKISAQLVESPSSNGYVLRNIRVTQQKTGLGTTLYHDNCAECHDNPQPDLHKQPPNLHGLFQHKTLPSGTPASDAQVRKSIIEGVGTMPAFDQRLNDRDVEALVQYLHSFN